MKDKTIKENLIYIILIIFSIFIGVILIVKLSNIIYIKNLIIAKCD